MGEGAAAARRRRRARAPREAARGRRRRARPRRPGRAGLPRRRRGAAARCAPRSRPLRVYGGRPFLLDRHLERLHASIAALALPRTGRRGRARPAGRRQPRRPITCCGSTARRARSSRPPRSCRPGSRSSVPGASRCGRSRRLYRALLGGGKATSYALSFAARQAAETAGADDALLVAGRHRAGDRDGQRLVARRATSSTRPAAGPGVLPGRHTRVRARARARPDGAVPARRAGRRPTRRSRRRRSVR